MGDKIVWGMGTPWKNSTDYFTYLRGGLRRVWSKHPVKLELIKRDRKQVPNPKSKGKATVWGFCCRVCMNEFTIKDCQVDHINPAGSLRCLEDIAGFVERLLYVTIDDLRLVCKNCNSALAYSERSGMSLEDALIEKEAIAICKLPIAAVRDWITSRGEVPEKTAKARREQIVIILKGRIK